MTYELSHTERSFQAALGGSFQAGMWGTSSCTCPGSDGCFGCDEAREHSSRIEDHSAQWLQTSAGKAYGALQYASAEMKGDREVVLTAVALAGYALQYASEEVKGDREVVLVAVAQNSRALEHASAALKGDRAVVLAAVAQDGMALCHASALQ